MHTQALLPGNTITDPQLQQDSVPYAAGAMGQMPAGCEQGGVTDTRFVGLDGEPPGTQPQPGAPPGRGRRSGRCKPVRSGPMSPSTSRRTSPARRSTRRPSDSSPLKSDHFDGRRFFNPGPTAPRRGVTQLLKWRFGGDRKDWPAIPPGPSFPPPPASVDAGSIALSFIGHSTFLLRLPGLTILTDPVFSERCSPVGWAGPRRARPPGLALEALPHIDLVLVSHNHYDHMDLPSLRRLVGRGSTSVISTLGNEAILKEAGFDRVGTLDWWESRSAGQVRVTATPARHFSRRGAFDANRTLWAGFMIASPAGQVLFAGDSGAGPHWAEIRHRLGPPDLALIPIGAYEPRWLMAPVHMNPAEAAQAHLDLAARQSVGMHFGTFKLTDEPVDAPERALAATGVADFTTLGFGETRVFSLAR